MTYTIETYEVVHYISRSEKKRIKKETALRSFKKKLAEKIQARS